MNYDLPKIIKELANATGDNFYQQMALQLNACTGAAYTIIARFDEQRQSARTLALAAGDQPGENFSYQLQGTPCKQVSENQLCSYPRGVRTEYPEDELFHELGIEGYVGAPLKNSVGEVFAVVASLFTAEVDLPDDVLALFQLFASRISAEIERTEAVTELLQVNNNLEQRVAARSRELTTAMQTLAEQEKMASLGQLVAGISHEVNTPLGVAVLSSSVTADRLQKLVSQLADGSLTKPALVVFCEDLQESNASVQHNLERAADLMGHFKKVAIDQHTDNKVAVDLSLSMEALVNSLKPKAGRKGVLLGLQCPEHCLVYTWPGDISQIVTNLIMNALLHAFPETTEQPRITLEMRYRLPVLELSLSDNGVGISEAVMQRIFEPFFTTSRERGGSGLGLSIVHNLVQKLEGDIQVNSRPGAGSQFVVTLNAEPQNTCVAMDSNVNSEDVA